MKPNFVADMYNLNKWIDDQTRKEYQIDVADRFSALKGLEASNVDDIWVKLKDKLDWLIDSIKASAEEKVGVLETDK